MFHWQISKILEQISRVEDESPAIPATRSATMQGKAIHQHCINYSVKLRVYRVW